MTQPSSTKGEENFLWESEASQTYGRLICWHAMEALLFGLSFILSFLTCISFSYVNQSVWPQCLTDYEEIMLHSIKKVQNAIVAPNRQDNATIITPSTTFSAGDPQRSARRGSVPECHFMQYSQLVAGVVAFMLCWFFTIFRPRRSIFVKKGKNVSAHLVLPTIILTLICTIILWTAVIVFQIELSGWCAKDSLLNTDCTSFFAIYANYVSRCMDLSQFFVDYVGNGAYTYLIASQVFSWMSVFVWLANLITLIIRCYYHYDFPTYLFMNNNCEKVRQYGNGHDTEESD